MTRIRVNDLHFSYGGLKVLEGVSFEASAGEMIAFLGPSGCGKTTLLRCICGLLDPAQGTVAVDNNDTARHRFCSFVFQKTVLLPWLTVRENLAFPFNLQGRPIPANTIEAQLAAMGLDGFDDCFPAELSAGMGQRVAFARALSEDRKILLLDEPFGGLDEMTKCSVATTLSRAIHDRHSTAILVTHSLHEAVFLADRVMVLSGRPGRIAQDIPIPLDQPRDAGLWLAHGLVPYVEKVRAALEAAQ